MLPKISAALSSIIAPISSGNLSSSGKQPEFQRFKPKLVGEDEPRQSAPQSQEQTESEKKKKKKLALVTNPEDEAPKNLPAAPPPPKRSVTVSFILLMNKIQKKRLAMLRWIGLTTYRTSTHTQKKSGKLRKGTMLDSKVG